MNQNVIMLGDINEDQLKNYTRLKQSLAIFNLRNVITEATRVTVNTSTLIDPIIVSDNLIVMNSEVISIDNSVSDHHATAAHIKVPTVISKPMQRHVWLYKRADFQRLNNLINTENWNFITMMSIEDATTLFTVKLLELMKLCIPFKLVTVRPNDKPWYDSMIRTFSRKRDRLKATAIKHPSENNWAKFKHARNRVNNMIKHAKEQFYSNIETTLTDLKSSNSRQYWKMLKHLINSHSHSDVIPPLKSVDIHGNVTIYTSEEEKATCLNNYFVSISTLDSSSGVLPVPTQFPFACLQNVSITEIEIIDLIKILITNKAVGEDLISHLVLKRTSESISKPLCLLFNKSLQECTFPSLWKNAIVMPLFKKGDSNIPSNYRPISLLSCIGKLMERAVYKHLYNHFIAHNLIYCKQSGFLRGHSTVYQLIDIFDQIARSIDDKKLNCMIFCDISKAFDRVWHRGLLFKLKQNGISGNILHWIESYLSNRTQKVFVGSAKSQSLEVNAGVPQGSVLGPLFFLIYVNDIVENLLSITRLFADDTSLSCTTSVLADLEGILNHDLCLINVWAKRWLVDFNPQKTEAILFTTQKNIPFPKLMFGNVPVTFVDEHKHLGLTFSSDGKWNNHINNILTSAAKILGVMRKVKYKLSRKCLNQIYFTHLRPLLEYACIVWDGCTLYDKELLEKIQNEAARIVSGLTRSVSLRNLYTEVKWPSLEKRRSYLKLINIYKMHNGQCPNYLTNLLPPTVHEQSSRNLRNAEDYTILSRRTLLYSRSFLPSAINLWNSLPIDIRNIDNISNFKTSLKQLFNLCEDNPQYFYTGDRHSSILHARLRNNCSNLNSDLFINHLKNTPLCACENDAENVEHYLFHCHTYRLQRIALFTALRSFHPLNCEMLLYGKPSLNNENNTIIFNEVKKYIMTTKRFIT